MRTILTAFALALSAVLGAFAGPANAVILWASEGTDGGTSGLYTIDTSTGTATLVGSLGLQKVGGIAFDSSGTLFGVSGGSRGPASLYTIDPGTAATALVGPVIGIQGVDALRFNATGTLYGGGWDGTVGVGVLVTIDPATGAVLTSTTMTGSGNAFAPGLAFNPADILYGSRGGSGGTEDLVIIDTVTGAQTAIGDATDVISDIVFVDGMLFGGSPTGDIFAIDPLTGVKTLLFGTSVHISGLAALQQVPEPGSLALLGAGLLGFVLASPRRARGRQSIGPNIILASGLIHARRPLPLLRT
jgi:hypothetical protein